MGTSVEQQSSTDETVDGFEGFLLVLIGVPILLLLFVVTPLACFIGLFFALFHALGLPKVVAIPLALPPGVGLVALMFYALHKGRIVWED